MFKKTYKFRIYPSKSQTTKLGLTLDLCRELYNSALQERRDAWGLNRINVSYQEQEKQLPETKKIREDLNSVYSQVLQDVLKRVDYSFQNFFRRVKAKRGTAGFPRFQGRHRCNSLTFKQSGLALESNRLNLSKVGKVKIKLHREIVGKIKTLTIIKDSVGKRFACFSVEIEKHPLEPINESLGVDCGISHFAVLSDGIEIDNPKFLRQEEKRLIKAQHRLCAQPKRSKERSKRRKIVAKIHARIKNKRNNFAHHISSFLVKNYDQIFFEDLNVRGMLKNHCLAKAIGGAAWSQTINYTIYKAEYADRTVRLVDPEKTSTTCHSCGHRQKMSLDTRIFSCAGCHLSICRDLNASRNILRIGLKSLGINILKAPKSFTGGNHQGN
jgi:putative transposase